MNWFKKKPKYKIIQLPNESYVLLYYDKVYGKYYFIKPYEVLSSSEIQEDLIHLLGSKGGESTMLKAIKVYLDYLAKTQENTEYTTVKEFNSLEELIAFHDYLEDKNDLQLDER